jgi:hypothetical protein
MGRRQPTAHAAGDTGLGRDRASGLLLAAMNEHLNGQEAA